MLKLAIPTVAVLVALAGYANAATDVGTLNGYNAASHSITLNGSTYLLASNVDASRLPVGQDSSVDYSVIGGQKVATSIDPILPAVGPQQDPSDMPSADQQ